MLSKHGTLESAILNVLWDLENEGIYTHSVKDVYESMKRNYTDKRAYTTIKTVMDRLHEKNILIRFKQGRKLYYRTTMTNREMVANALKDIASRYCNGDIVKLSQILNSLTEPYLVGA